MSVTEWLFDRRVFGLSHTASRLVTVLVAALVISTPINALGWWSGRDSVVERAVATVIEKHYRPPVGGLLSSEPEKFSLVALVRERDGVVALPVTMSVYYAVEVGLEVPIERVVRPIDKLCGSAERWRLAK